MDTDKIKKQAHKYLIDKGCLSIGQKYTAFQVERMLFEFAQQVEVKREIQAYSSNSNTELCYKNKYWFHRWISKSTALIEDEQGKLTKAKHREFYFKNIIED